MPKRSIDWKEEFSKELLASESDRREYFMALIDEGFSWKEALEQVVKTIGLKEYADLSGFKPPNLLSQLRPDKDIRISTLEKMVNPLGVEISFFEKKAS